MCRLLECILIALIAALFFVASGAWLSDVRAQPDPVPLPVTEIAQNVFVAAGPHELATPANADHISNSSFVIGSNAVAVIDTGGSFGVGKRLLAAIREKTALPIRYVINTHVHPDHILGNAAFKDVGAQIVGHQNLPEALAERAMVYLDATRDLIGTLAFAGTEAIAPTLLVKDRTTLDLGGRQLVLDAWPVAHTNTDLTVFDDKTRTWFLGDLLFSGHIPALDGSLKGWLTVIDALKKRSADRVVPGHGPVSMLWPESAAPMEAYLRMLSTQVRQLLKAGDTMQEAADTAMQSERSKWALFDEFNARNVIAAYHELEWE
jgi:quinoprotein relay system zinc metallohydrolase 2